MTVQLKAAERIVSQIQLDANHNRLCFDAYNLKLGIRLSVTELAFFIFLGLVGENSNFLIFTLLYNLSSNFSRLNIGSADLCAVTVNYEQNFIESNRLILGNIELLDKKNSAVLGFVLLSAGFKNSVHRLTFFNIRLAIVRRTDTVAVKKPQ